jgi:hypothetical protein
MSATRIVVQPEMTGPNAPEKTVTGKPGVETQTPPNQQTPPAAERPAYIPEKFWKDGKVDTEGMAKSYSELEKKNTAKPAEGEQTPGEKKPGEQTTETPKGDEVFKPFFDEFEKNGQLSDESYAALEKQGFSRSIVDAYARGVQAQRAEHEGKVFEAVGGQEQYAKVVDWAGKNLSQPEIDAFNSLLQTGSPDQIALAATGLNTRYQAANGSPAKLLHGSSSGSAVAPFRSSSEVTRAMSDARYKTDEAYRDEVAARLAISDVL